MVEVTPADPPTWSPCRAMATYANALLAERAGPGARLGGARAGPRPAAAGSPWVEADAWSTLGLMGSRERPQ